MCLICSAAVWQCHHVWSRVDCRLCGVSLSNVWHIAMHVPVCWLLPGWQPHGTWLQHVPQSGGGCLRLWRHQCHESVWVSWAFSLVDTKYLNVNLSLKDRFRPMAQWPHILDLIKKFSIILYNLECNDDMVSWLFMLGIISSQENFSFFLCIIIQRKKYPTIFYRTLFFMMTYFLSLRLWF